MKTHIIDLPVTVLESPQKTREIEEGRSARRTRHDCYRATDPGFVCLPKHRLKTNYCRKSARSSSNQIS